MTTTRDELTKAIAAYAQMAGLSRAAVRASADLTARAVAYTRERAEAAKRARGEWERERR